MRRGAQTMKQCGMQAFGQVAGFPRIMPFLPIPRLLQIACGAAWGVAWTFGLWKKFCVCETDTPAHMPLGRGADNAATPTERQRDHTDKSGESCDSGV